QLFLLSDKREAPGKPVSVRGLLDRGAARIESDLKGQPAIQAKLFTTLSRVYAGLGQYSESKQFAQKTLALPLPPGTDSDLQRADVLHQLGRTEQNLGNIQEARALYKKALDIRLRVRGENHPDVAKTLNQLGYIDALMERYDEATAAHERAL